VSSRVMFAVDCTHCPGDGVRRGKHAGVDWPAPCTCGGRKEITQYQLGRLIDESPRAVVRLHECRTTPGVSSRLLCKLHEFIRHGWRSRRRR